ncbi:hypothetical protein CANCADRAFT_19853, partial [Tortispora caseinolytica NRRL Y-17796]
GPSRSESRSTSRGIRTGPRVATLSDMRENSQSARDLFTGGEKSGLAVHNPRGGGPAHNSIVDAILKQAEMTGRMPEEDDSDTDSPFTASSSRNRSPRQPRFTGSGFRLGTTDEQGSSSTEAGPSNLPPAAENEDSFSRVTRKLTFWQDGFSLEDGPLMRYDDPENKLALEAINSGQAPLHLLNVHPGQSVNVNVDRRLDEPYRPPRGAARKFGFSGSGHRLGSPVPGQSPEPVSEASTPPAQAPAEESAAAATHGDIQVQIRLIDGTRLTPRFNSTDPVQAIYTFLDGLDSASTVPYVLQTVFPRQELNDKQISIKEAGLANSVITQR